MKAYFWGVLDVYRSYFHIVALVPSRRGRPVSLLITLNNRPAVCCRSSSSLPPAWT